MLASFLKDIVENPEDGDDDKFDEDPKVEEDLDITKDKISLKSSEFEGTDAQLLK